MGRSVYVVGMSEDTPIVSWCRVVVEDVCEVPYGRYLHNSLWKMFVGFLAEGVGKVSCGRFLWAIVVLNAVCLRRSGTGRV